MTGYSSLSAIAQAITGTAWSSPRFFAHEVPQSRTGASRAAQLGLIDNHDHPGGEQISPRQSNPTP
jgi:hypothetical protein